MTEFGDECHREDYTVCVPPFLSLNTTLCSTVLVTRACAILHSGESLMMLHTSEMRDASNDGSQLSVD